MAQNFLFPKQQKIAPVAETRNDLIQPAVSYPWSAPQPSVTPAIQQGGPAPAVPINKASTVRNAGGMGIAPSFEQTYSGRNTSVGFGGLTSRPVGATPMGTALPQPGHFRFTNKIGGTGTSPQGINFGLDLNKQIGASFAGQRNRILENPTLLAAAINAKKMVSGEIAPFTQGAINARITASRDRAAAEGAAQIRNAIDQGITGVRLDELRRRVTDYVQMAEQRERQSIDTEAAIANANFQQASINPAIAAGSAQEQLLAPVEQAQREFQMQQTYSAPGSTRQYSAFAPYGQLNQAEAQFGLSQRQQGLQERQQGFAEQQGLAKQALETRIQDWAERQGGIASDIARRKMDLEERTGLASIDIAGRTETRLEEGQRWEMAFKDKSFNTLSAAQKAQLDQDAERLGVDRESLLANKAYQNAVLQETKDQNRITNEYNRQKLDLEMQLARGNITQREFENRMSMNDFLLRQEQVVAEKERTKAIIESTRAKTEMPEDIRKIVTEMQATSPENFALGSGMMVQTPQGPALNEESVLGQMFSDSNRPLILDVAKEGKLNQEIRNGFISAIPANTLVGVPVEERVRLIDGVRKEMLAKYNARPPIGYSIHELSAANGATVGSPEYISRAIGFSLSDEGFQNAISNHEAKVDKQVVNAINKQANLLIKSIQGK